MNKCHIHIICRANSLGIKAGLMKFWVDLVQALFVEWKWDTQKVPEWQSMGKTMPQLIERHFQNEFC
jgi:hypothetical protein